MNYFTLFGIFFILWWIVFFIVLPLNITTHMDKGIDVEGIHGSVPINPNLLFKIIVTTFVTFIILLISIPLLIQTYGIYVITYLLAFRLSIPYNIAAPAALIGTSNFFELAVAVAISLFGLNSGAALATVVGVLVEVPVMLSLVAISNRTKSYFGDLNGNS